MSIRDLARNNDVTSGAIYGHFRNKADLLAAAIEDRIETDLEGPKFGTGGLTDYLARQWRAYRSRAGLRALLVEGAHAAHVDDDAGSGSASCTRRSSRSGARSTARCKTATADSPTSTWTPWSPCSGRWKLGLGVLEAADVEIPKPAAWSATLRQLLEGVELDASDAGVRGRTIECHHGDAQLGDQIEDSRGSRRCCSSGQSQSASDAFDHRLHRLDLVVGHKPADERLGPLAHHRGPGSIVFTRMPERVALDRERVGHAVERRLGRAVDTDLGGPRPAVRNGGPSACFVEPLDTLTIQPSPRSAMPGITAWARSIGACTFTSNMIRRRFSGIGEQRTGRSRRPRC